MGYGVEPEFDPYWLYDESDPFIHTQDGISRIEDPESEGGILWDQIGFGVAEVVGGVVAIVGSSALIVAATAATGVGGYVAGVTSAGIFVGAAQAIGFGMSNIGSGFMGVRTKDPYLVLLEGTTNAVDMLGNDEK